ncbi:hypothetical protein [Sphingopyxis sp. LK2115]|jgi:hypothetical protein|uniref:hypothetical protein n=1 Tax=Sphingopyxis sp. LK2115 TaxID=2744558 RepID=UPI001660BB3E|nr:hypothetical protein [Sphingopyxis sp. LK2115]
MLRPIASKSQHPGCREQRKPGPFEQPRDLYMPVPWHEKHADVKEDEQREAPMRSQSMP